MLYVRCRHNPVSRLASLAWTVDLTRRRRRWRGGGQVRYAQHARSEERLVLVFLGDPAWVLGLRLDLSSFKYGRL